MSGGNRISLRRVLDVVAATIATALAGPLMLCMALDPEGARSSTTSSISKVKYIEKWSVWLDLEDYSADVTCSTYLKPQPN